MCNKWVRECMFMTEGFVTKTAVATHGVLFPCICLPDPLTMLFENTRVVGGENCLQLSISHQTKKVKDPPP